MKHRGIVMSRKGMVASAHPLISCLLYTSGFLPCNIVDVPFGFPVIVSAFVGHGWQGVVVQLIIIAVGALVYTPFVLMSNKQAKKELN